MGLAMAEPCYLRILHSAMILTSSCAAVQTLFLKPIYLFSAFWGSSRSGRSNRFFVVFFARNVSEPHFYLYAPSPEFLFVYLLPNRGKCATQGIIVFSQKLFKQTTPIRTRVHHGADFRRCCGGYIANENAERCATREEILYNNIRLLFLRIRFIFMCLQL